MSTEEEEELEDEGMTFWEHLEELRSRLLKMAIAAAIGATVAWFLKEEILQWLLGPFQEAWVAHFNEEAKVHFKGPADLFITYLKLSLIAGIIVALPLIFWQIWAFVAPGLYKKEKRFAIPFVFASTGLFVSGAYFGMTLAFPIAFTYLLGFAAPSHTPEPEKPATELAAPSATASAQAAPSSTGLPVATAAPVPSGGSAPAPTQEPPRVTIAEATEQDQTKIKRKNNVVVEATIMIDDYIKFISRMLLAFGTVFELPVVVFFLSVAGVINHRHLIKFFRYFVVIAFAAAAIFTPPDLMSQFLLAVPMTILYIVSIGIAYIFGRKDASMNLPKDDD